MTGARHFFAISIAWAFVLTLLTATTVQGQPPPRTSMRGLGVQAYPAGLIAYGHYSYFINSSQAATLHLGFNLTNRRDWGKHDDERGSGAGAGLAWRYYLNEKSNGLHLGVRTDFWFMRIEWEQDAGESDTSEIVVAQPTAQVGYTFFPSEGRWVFEATAALGAEINIQTRGEQVGEGAIFLLGFGAAYLF